VARQVRLVFLHVLFCVIVAGALFLTQSRGAVGASFVGAVAGVILITMRPVTADRQSGQTGQWHRYATIFAAFVVVVGLFALFAGRSVYRMEEQGAEDARWCSFASTIQDIEDHPLFGTGVWRVSGCLPAYRIWRMRRHPRRLGSRT